VQTEPANVFAPIRPTRGSSDVIAQIRRAILSGQYRPVDRLPTEREMAQQFITFEELAEARLALETTAAQLAAQRATPEDLAALKAAIEGPIAPPTSDTAAASLDFHTALVIASHNQALLAMFRATRALIQQAFDTLHAQQPDMADAARKTHGEL
jgi:DNA-binding FadR family transcriptional regulator